MVQNFTIKSYLFYSLLLCLMSSILYAQNDFDKPVLSSFTISPYEVDISSGVVTLTATVNAKDASGVATPSSYGVYTTYNGNQYNGSTWTLITRLMDDTQCCLLANTVCPVLYWCLQ